MDDAEFAKKWAEFTSSEEGEELGEGLWKEAIEWEIEGKPKWVLAGTAIPVSHAPAPIHTVLPTFNAQGEQTYKVGMLLSLEDMHMLLLARAHVVDHDCASSALLLQSFWRDYWEQIATTYMEVRDGEG